MLIDFDKAPDKARDKVYSTPSGALIYFCAAIHSAVRVFTGEADEIAAQSLGGFCDDIAISSRYGCSRFRSRQAVRRAPENRAT